MRPAAQPAYLYSAAVRGNARTCRVWCGKLAGWAAGGRLGPCLPPAGSLPSELTDLVSRNQAAWTAGSSIRRGLLAFGDDGDGSPFCVWRGGGPDILFWNPVLNEVTHLARDLTSFWNPWIKGSLPPH